MSADPPVNPPRKKHSVLWWLGGLFLLLLLLFLFQLFGPNPPIIISRETTHITEPLGPNGLPDYEQHVLDLYRKDVTPESNAALLLWQALGPGDLDPQDQLAVATEIGLELIPPGDQALQPLYGSENRKRIAAWLQRRGQLRFADRLPDDESIEQPLEMDSSLLEDEADRLSDVVDEVIDQSMSRPWASVDIPPLADWIAANDSTLDLIVEASRRPRYNQPSPTLTNNRRDLLIAVLLPHIQSVREAGRALPARAMWRLGEGRPMESWQDLLALHRLSRLVGQGRTLVEQLVAFAMSNIACDGTHTLLHHGDLTVEQARQVQRDLAALPSFAGMADSIDEWERVSALDTVLVGSADAGGLFAAAEMRENHVGDTVLNVVSVDWNLVLRETNRWYDRLAAAARLPARASRNTEFAQINADMELLLSKSRTPTTLLAGVISRRQRSELVSAIIVGIFLPALDAAANAQDLANTKLQLTRLAAALAVYRAEHNAYPEKLDDLVPPVLGELPADLYNAKPYFYQRDGDGYLLYSTGENGADDGGSHEQWGVHKGQWLNQLDEAAAERLRPKIPAGADDISIRLPRPPFKLPQFAPPTDER